MKTKLILVDTNANGLELVEIYCDMTNVSVDEAGTLDIDFSYDFKFDKIVNLKKDVNMDDAKTIFLSGECGIPRAKVRDWCKSNNKSIVRDISKADVAFYGPKDFTSINRSVYASYANKSTAINIIKNNSNFKGYINYNEIALQLSNMDYPYVVIARNIFSYNSPVKDSNGFRKYGGHIYYIRCKDYHEFENLVAMNNIYHADAIQKYVNNGVVLDEDMYQSLAQMFDSQDVSNHNIAMQIMTNCDFEKSVVYLYAIFEGYVNKIHNNPGKNSVAFKNLLDWLGAKTKYNRFSFDALPEYLIDKGLFTQSNADKALKFIRQEAQDTWSYNSVSYMNVDYNDEVKAKIIAEPVENLELI